MAVSKLEKDANGAFLCPQCGRPLRTVEGGTVMIRGGKADMENVSSHFRCASCDSIFRRIATTEYFQWAEK